MINSKIVSQRIGRVFASRRRFGLTAFGLLGVMLCTGANSTTGCQNSGSGSIGPSGAEVGAAIAGVGAAVVAVVVVVAVNHDHHFVRGCVYNDPAGGFKLQTSDSTVYSIEGDPASIKVGDMVKFHGSKVKKTKDSKGDRVFRVDQVKKDYGPCQIKQAQPQATGGS